MKITRADCVPLVLRLVTGIGLVAHGLAKLNRGPSVFAATLDAMQVPAPTVMAWVTILIELVGGLAVLAGAAIWLVGLPAAAVLLVAMFKVHWRFGFSSIKLVSFTAAGPTFGPPGYELTLFYLACLAALVLSGPGPLSVDRALARRRGPAPRVHPKAP
ncbi:MAG: DoxX family protein [Vicinamibacteraceae bacterium]